MVFNAKSLVESGLGDGGDRANWGVRCRSDGRVDFFGSVDDGGGTRGRSGCCRRG